MGELMSANENLLHATLAINFVKRAMTIGAQNKLSDVFTSFGKSLICVAAGRSVDVAVPAKEGFPSWIREASAKARQLGCGNCGEQAAIAFCFCLIMDSVQLTIWPELMQITHL